MVSHHVVGHKRVAKGLERRGDLGVAAVGLIEQVHQLGTTAFLYLGKDPSQSAAWAAMGPVLVVDQGFEQSVSISLTCCLPYSGST